MALEATPELGSPDWAGAGAAHTSHRPAWGRGRAPSWEGRELASSLSSAVWPWTGPLALLSERTLCPAPSPHCTPSTPVPQGAGSLGYYLTLLGSALELLSSEVDRVWILWSWRLCCQRAGSPLPSGSHARLTPGPCGHQAGRLPRITLPLSQPEGPCPSLPK